MGHRLSDRMFCRPSHRRHTVLSAVTLRAGCVSRCPRRMMDGHAAWDASRTRFVDRTMRRTAEKVVSCADGAPSLRPTNGAMHFARDK